MEPLSCMPGGHLAGLHFHVEGVNIRYWWILDPGTHLYPNILSFPVGRLGQVHWEAGGIPVLDPAHMLLPCLHLINKL